MAYKLEPLQAEDVPQCVQIYFDAFQNAHSLACWPRVPGVRKWWENMFYDELKDPKSHWLEAVSTKTGDLAGFCKWVEPKPGVLPDIELPEWPKDADQALCNETFGAWVVNHRNLMSDRGHWYLEMVATHPDHQGKGAGSLMMRYGCERADQDHVESYLEASPEAVTLYEKFGFTEAARTDTLIENVRVTPGVWYRNLYMIRPKAEG